MAPDSNTVNRRAAGLAMVDHNRHLAVWNELHEFRRKLSGLKNIDAPDNIRRADFLKHDRDLAEHWGCPLPYNSIIIPALNAAAYAALSQALYSAATKSARRSLPNVTTFPLTRSWKVLAWARGL